METITICLVWNPEVKSKIIKQDEFKVRRKDGIKFM